jgi:hypothetical protein
VHRAQLTVLPANAKIKLTKFLNYDIEGSYGYQADWKTKGYTAPQSADVAFSFHDIFLHNHCKVIYNL